METQLKKHAWVALIAAAGMLASTALGAEPARGNGVPQIAVDYGDLDLGSEQGVRELHRRLTAAAERVCPRTDGRINVEAKTAARECRKHALERAVQAIGNPSLAALHAATTPRG